MVKSIQFKGINHAAPQSSSPDGACQEIINTRFIKGCWRPVGLKDNIKSSVFTYNGVPIVFSSIYLHDIEGGLISGQPNWIGCKDQSNHVELYQINPSTGIATLIQDNLNSTDFDVTVSFLKRWMLVTTGTGLLIYLWTDSAYAQIESLPVPEVDLHKNNVILVDQATMGQSETASEVLGNYYQVLNSQSSSEGRMYGSIMYIVAYKLFDGSFILPSIPKYFEMSNDGVIIMSNAAGTGNYRTHFKFSLSGIKASIDNTLFPSTLEGTKDLIQSICVFATRCTPLHKIDEVSFPNEVLFSSVGYGPDKTIRYSYFSTFFPMNSDFPKLAQSESWYKIHEFVFDSLVGATGRTTADVDTKNFYQDYATRKTLPTDQFSHHDLVPKIAYTYNDRLHVANVRTVYGPPYIQWNKFRAGYDMGSDSIAGKAIVWLKTGLGKAVVVHDISIPYFKTASEVVDSFGSAYLNSAIARVANLNTGSSGAIPGSAYLKKKTVPAGFTTVVTTGISYPYPWINNVESYDVCYRTALGGTNYLITPSCVGYNDSRAYRMMITFNSGYVLLDQPLKKNEGMNFAYYHGEKFSADDLSATDNFKDTIGLPSIYTVVSNPSALETPFDTNRVQVSEIQNPLIFPAKNSYQIGTGDILALAAGSEPLSTGQFGQFPLQVFTSKGIYAMEVGTGGILYTNVLPVNGEVADNPKNILPAMGGVIYSTPRGLFALHGRQVTELAEIIEGDPVLWKNKTEINTLITDAKFTTGLNNKMDEVDFLTYLPGAKIGFDQIWKELIVTNSNYDYSYVFSFESKLWYKAGVSYRLLINAWPRLYGLTDESIYDLSKEVAGQTEVMIITCAQSFEVPGISKKLERAILRCDVTTAGGKYAGLYLFGSDDLNTWQFITGKQRTGTGLKDLIIQRSHTAMKYFAFVLNGNFSTDSEIKDIELSVTPKWNNKLR